MKTKVVIAILALSNLTTLAETADSSVVIINPKHVLITETTEGLTTIVTTPTDSQTYHQFYTPYSDISSHISGSGLSLTGKSNRNSATISWDATAGGLGFGFCSAPGAPESAGMEMGKSFELSWLNILAVKATNRFGNSFSLGVGINWRNYRTTLENCFFVNDGQVEISDYPEGVEPRLSRIKIFSVQFPLLYRQKLPFGITKERLAIALGPIFNLNSHASVLTAWRGEKSSSEYKVNGINVRPFTIDLFAMVHLFECGGLYVRYSPYNALTGHNHLNFHQFSTGIMFFM